MEPHTGLPSLPKLKVWKMPEWVEPVVIVGILFGAMFITRRKSYSILDSSNSPTYKPIKPDRDDFDYGRDSFDSDGYPPPSPSPSSSQFAPKRRRILGIWTVHTPNSFRFARHVHSRILQKFPFLIEMFYWILTYFFYRMTAYLSAVWYGGSMGLWNVAQDHGISILELEAWITGSRGTGTDRWIEWRVQQWFLAGVAEGDIRELFLTILNRVYALIHIPGTVGFIAWYYAMAPSHQRFCTVRRTMSLLNLFAFFTFTVFPCMPPRLLPREYGFLDTVNAEDAASVWMSGNYVNKLAAMPSMHFGYAFCIGCVFVYESGFIRTWCRPFGSPKKLSLDDASILPPTPDSSSDDLEVPRFLKQMEDAGEQETRRSAFVRAGYLISGVCYPALILLAIVSTANHYILDAVAGAFVVLISYLGNRFLLSFLVLEDWLLWALRLKKPEPTTGMKNTS
ncbi:uncharacterized protein PG986_014664 [Apiospora aurea]|uniref:Inositolphosphotransferase Aur1/Ipt1 domain-containing protein n=1 Tax=Apiospora aurea TaxID=335848 RepID=A0ABR1PTN1_9PEZI